MDILQCLPFDCECSQKENYSIFDEYTYLMKVSNDKKKGTYWNRYSVFINNQASHMCSFYVFYYPLQRGLDADSKLCKEN